MFVCARHFRLCCTRLSHHASTSSQGGHSHKIKTPQVHLDKTDEEGHDVTRIRNIGIIAHIDAGKTTTTERLLYLVGATPYMGDVDKGDTVTDFMIQERERGITIQSAAITFYWNHNRINLIDTPGHVDFTHEVERCLRVLDGAVTILDASAGVQAQTLTVWRQTNKYSIPSVVFLNKMDKPAASVEKSLNSIERKLRIRPVLLYSLVFENGQIRGLVDLVHGDYIKWPKNDPYAKQFGRATITETNDKYGELMKGREKLIDDLTDMDDQLAETVLSLESLSLLDPTEHIIPAIRRVTLSRQAVPVSCGSALKTVGVQPVLDMVRDYLPNPNDQPHSLTQFYNDRLCALAFKTTHDKRLGPLTFVRVYSGQLTTHTCFNANRNAKESISKLFIPQSDELQSTNVVRDGNIAVIPGLKRTVTGDTLVESEAVALKAAHSHAVKHGTLLDTKDHHELVDQSTTGSDRLLLAGIETPFPVYFCSIEPPNLVSQNRFEAALAQLEVEDPSLRVRFDKETQQTVLEGMGELHIEIIKDRLLREFGLDVFVGPLQVSYKEGIATTAEDTLTLKEVFNKSEQVVTLSLAAKYVENAGNLKHVHLGPIDLELGRGIMRKERISALTEGCQNALLNGPLQGYPVIDVAVSLRSFEASRGAPNSLVAACACRCLSNVLTLAGSFMLEPIMQIEVTLDGDDGGSIGAVTSELAKRRATINMVSDGREKMVQASAPLVALSGLSSSIRTVSSGLGHLHLEFAGYVRMSLEAEAALLGT